MKKHILTLLLLIVVSTSFAQIRMQGVVKDSIGIPLELANVIAINQETDAIESFAITNDKGRYILSLKKNTTYKLKASYVGFKTFEDVITTKEERFTKDFILILDNSLDAVELTYEMPVSIKGDTLVYNADSFKNGSERKLKDILKKLPGVEVDADGQVFYQGKAVSKTMVEGKDFFDGDTKLASKNIPADAVDKIEMLRNHSDVGQLKGVQNNEDNVAMNIKLKEGKKNFWFGSITAAVGNAPKPNNGLYLVQPKLFYYSPKYSLSTINDINNVGEPALTAGDLFKFSGGFKALGSNNGTSLSSGNSGVFELLNSGSFEQSESKLSASNFNYSPTKKIGIDGFLIHNSNRNQTRQKSFIDYIEVEDNPNTSIDESQAIAADEFKTQTGKEATNLTLAKLSATYKPNRNNQLDYDVFARLSKTVINNNLFSSVVGNVNQLNKADSYSINQNLNYYYTLNDDNIFALEAQYLTENDDPFYNALLDNDPTNNNATNPNDRDAYDNIAVGLGLDRDQQSYNLNQDRLIKSNKLDAKLDYYNVLNPKNHMRFTLGTLVSRQDFNSNIFQFLDNGNLFNPIPTLTNEGEVLSVANDTQFNFSDMYLGFQYRLKSGKFTFTPSLSLHAYSNNNNQFGETHKNNFFRILPDFETRVKFRSSESLSLRYKMTNTFADVSKLAKGLLLVNYSNISYGEPELQNGLSHNINLSYSNFNMYNYTNIFANAAYIKRIDQIRSNTNFENVINTNTYFNSNFADEMAYLMGGVQRRFGKLRAGFNVNFNYNKTNLLVQDIKSVSKSFTQSYTPTLRTNFREAPNVGLTYNYSVSKNNQGISTTKFITKAPSIDFDAYIWDALTFVTDFTYSEQNDGNQKQAFKTWNASLSYRKNSDAKWEFQIKASNLLNIESNVSNRSGSVAVYNSETFIQPRFVTFRLTYSL